MDGSLDAGGSRVRVALIRQQGTAETEEHAAAGGGTEPHDVLDSCEDSLVIDPRLSERVDQASERLRERPVEGRLEHLRRAERRSVKTGSESFLQPIAFPRGRGAKPKVQTGKHPGELKDMVTTPGGTTIEGIHALERGGLRRTVMDAVEAAALKSRELGKA